ANLAGANLAGARLQEVNLQGADLRGANLTGTCFESVTGWTETAQEDDIFPLEWFQPRFAT
ncbi:MAG: pentapeptide repeat-containing protein, partial [Microcystis sp.]